MLLLEQFEHLTLHPKNAARLKELVLQLAVQGKLTENWRKQNPAAEPAAALLKRIEAEKAQLVKEKKMKKEKPLELISEDEVPYTLPEGWVWCRLGSITYNFGQKTPDTAFSYIDVASVDNKKGVIGDELQTILPNEAPSRARKVVEEGCVIYSTVRPYLLNIAIVEKSYEPEAIASTAFAILNPIPSFDKKFLYFYLRSIPFINYVESQMIGVAYPAINDAKLFDGLVPLPPLAEQEAIVARVEELMQKIEELEKQTTARIQLKQHLGAAALQQLTTAENEELEQNWLFLKQHFASMFDEAANVKKLRETILQLAVQGKLTATWRKYNPTTEPASELLKRIQAEKTQLVKEKKIKKEKPLEPITEDEVPYTLPEGWVWCRMADIASKLGAGSTPKGGKEVYVDEGVPFLRSQNVYDDGLRLNGVAQITGAVHQKMSGTHVQPKDILLNITGGSIGRCALVADDFDTANVSQHVAIIRMVDSGIRKYIHYLMTSEMIQRLIMDVQVGVSREGLSMTKLREFLIPLPPISEQEAIVAKVDQLMQLCDELERQIQQSKQETEALMQAVVQEALQVQEEASIL